jgi:hypothetical protein
VRKKKRTVSETETHRVVIVRGRSMQAYCRGCGRNVKMVTIECAAAALGISVPSVRERSSNNKGHCLESSGTSWVCWDWISQPS